MPKAKRYHNQQITRSIAFETKERLKRAIKLATARHGRRGLSRLIRELVDEKTK